MEENTARLLQLEEDLIGVTQKGLQKETELDWYVFPPHEDGNMLSLLSGVTVPYSNFQHVLQSVFLLFCFCSKDQKLLEV